MSGWIGVDLDGTLAEYKTGDGVASIGQPIAAMTGRVRQWLDDGQEVRIITARVGNCNEVNDEGIGDTAVFAGEQRVMIEAWCLAHIGKVLKVTCQKDFQMIQLWDDRCVQIVPNTGEPAIDHYYQQGLQHGRQDTAGQAEGHYKRGYQAGILSVLEKQNIHEQD